MFTPHHAKLIQISQVGMLTMEYFRTVMNLHYVCLKQKTTHFIVKVQVYLLFHPQAFLRQGVQAGGHSGVLQEEVGGLGHPQETGAHNTHTRTRTQHTSPIHHQGTPAHTSAYCPISKGFSLVVRIEYIYMNIKLRPLIVIAYPHPGLNVRKIIYIIILTLFIAFV